MHPSRSTLTLRSHRTELTRDPQRWFARIRGSPPLFMLEIILDSPKFLSDLKLNRQLLAENHLSLRAPPSRAPQLYSV